MEELQRSIHPKLDAIGVNNRNLADFTVSVQTSFDLAGSYSCRFYEDL